MRPPNRRDQAAEEARKRILAVAAACIVRDGLAQVRMASIAREAGVSTGLLHYHFDTKEQLLAAVLDYSGTISHDLTVQALGRAGSEPANRLSTFLDRCLPSDPQLTHDWLIWQELDLLCLRQPDLAEVGASLYETLYRSVAEIVVDGIDTGVFHIPHDQARMLAECAVALCDGLGARVLAGSDLSLDDARTRVGLTVGRLVGHDGPLPSPDLALQEAGA